MSNKHTATSGIIHESEGASPASPVPAAAPVVTGKENPTTGTHDVVIGTTNGISFSNPA